MQSIDKATSYTERSTTAFQMAFIAGFVDVFSFVNYNKLFTAHITGNIVIAIGEIIHHTPGVTIKLISLPVFAIVAMSVVWISEHLGRKKSLLAILLLIEALFLVLFMIAGNVVSHENSTSIPYIITGMFAVSAMGIHNTLLRTYMCSLPPCTVMTGNFCQFLVDTVSFVYKRRAAHPIETPLISHTGIHLYGNILLAFCLGGVLAAIGTITIGFWSICLPLATLCGMIFCCLKLRKT